MSKLNPYLHFNNNCEEAFNFYRSVFGGQFMMLSRYKDAPPELAFTEAEKEKIMHVSLPIGKDTVLMGSDTPELAGMVNGGSNFSISVSADSENEAEKIFNKLSEGGQVTMPIEKSFWNAYFGMLVDKFGVQWMVSYDYGQ